MEVAGTLVAQVLLHGEIAAPFWRGVFEMTTFQSSVFVLASMIASAAIGCTANVSNPKVDENANDTETMCTKTCDDTLTSCTAKCNDDGCKASCTTAHTNCVTACTPADGG
jgi:hypothetical protein